MYEMNHVYPQFKVPLRTAQIVHSTAKIMFTFTQRHSHTQISSIVIGRISENRDVAVGI